MSVIRLFAVVFVGLIGIMTASAVAPPPVLDIARWIEDLESEDADTWRQAVDRLWKAGRPAEAALRAAMKKPDPDVRLRARLVLARFDWGIFPDTPPAIVRAIERYRDGDRTQQSAAVEELIKQGRAGYLALQRVMAREPDTAIRQQIADRLKREYRPMIRELLASGDRMKASELLELSALAGHPEAVRDLATFWLLTGQARTKAAELERQAATGDRLAAVRCAYLHRANGDLAAARRMAEKAEDVNLLAGIVEEQDDFKALARMIPADIQNSPSKLATLLHHAGDRDGFEGALAKITANDSWSRTHAYFFNDRPRQGIDAYRKSGNVAGACSLLSLQGRYREALAMSGETETRDAEQRLWLLMEHAVINHRLGEKDQARKLLGQVLVAVEKTRPRADSLLAGVLKAGIRMNQRMEVLKDIGKVLDELKVIRPYALLRAMSTRDGDVLLLWWDFLRKKFPDTQPSATLMRLVGWFEQGKSDKDFDTLISEAKRTKAPMADAQDRWLVAVSRACEVVGKTDKAEEILKVAGRALNSAAACMRLGDFYFDRKRYREARIEYAGAVSREPGNVLAVYMHGVSQIKLGQVKLGQSLIERARLMPLADEATRYALVQGLNERGLHDEANAERLVLFRTASFREIHAANMASGLGVKAVREKRWLEAAYYYRRLYLTLALGRGSFLESSAYLRVPGLTHMYQARGLLAAGKLDAALQECKLVLEYLPEDIGLPIDLIRALDKAKRKADADKLFDDVFAHHQKASADCAKSAHHHNQLAWLSARCGRRLDVALKAARTATALMPEAIGYLDTLAEVHFQRGDKDEAVAVMKRVVKMAPANKYYRAQLRRMEAGDPRAELPEER